MAKLSENAVKILSFLQANPDGDFTASDLAETMGLQVKTVNGVITGGLIGKNHSRDFVERVEQKVEVDGETKTVKFIKLTDKGAELDPNAEF